MPKGQSQTQHTKIRHSTVLQAGAHPLVPPQPDPHPSTFTALTTVVAATAATSHGVADGDVERAAPTWQQHTPSPRRVSASSPRISLHILATAAAHPKSINPFQGIIKVGSVIRLHQHLVFRTQNFDVADFHQLLLPLPYSSTGKHIQSKFAVLAIIFGFGIHPKGGGKTYLLDLDSVVGVT